MCLGVKHTFINGGDCKGWSLMTPNCIPNCTPTLGVAFMQSCKCLKPWLERQTSTKLGSLDIIKKVLKHKCLKCLHIVHLNLICMSYVKLKIWFPTINPLKVRVKWGPTGACYTLLEDIFKGYKILPLHFQKLLDLRNIWTSKIFE